MNDVGHTNDGHDNNGYHKDEVEDTYVYMEKNDDYYVDDNLLFYGK